MVGGFEAKGLAYACVIFALERMVSRRWSQVWILLGLASAFHVLVGGWATIAAIASWLHCEVRGSSVRSKFKSQLPSLLGGLALAGIGIVPPLLTELHSSREMVDTANRIYVDARISHHLLFGSFPVLHVARFGIHCIRLGTTGPVSAGVELVPANPDFLPCQPVHLVWRAASVRAGRTTRCHRRFQPWPVTVLLVPALRLCRTRRIVPLVRRGRARMDAGQIRYRTPLFADGCSS